MKYFTLKKVKQPLILLYLVLYGTGIAVAAPVDPAVAGVALQKEQTAPFAVGTYNASNASHFTGGQLCRPRKPHGARGYGSNFL
jgi:hypothetical protein